MTERTLADEIITIVKSESNDNPAPEKAHVVGNYDGINDRVDIDVDNLGIMKYVPCFGDTDIGVEGVVCFVGGDLNSPVFLTSRYDYYRKEDLYTKSEVDTLIDDCGGSESIDLDNIGVDFTYSFGLMGSDDTITIDPVLFKK